MTHDTRGNELNVINGTHIVLAALLFFSPWAFNYADLREAAWTAWISAILIAAVAVAAIARLQEWQQWCSLALGLWVALAPWVVGFAQVHEAMWTHVALGLAVAALAAVEIAMLRGGFHRWA